MHALQKRIEAQRIFREANKAGNHISFRDCLRMVKRKYKGLPVEEPAVEAPVEEPPVEAPVEDSPIENIPTDVPPPPVEE